MNAPGSPTWPTLIAQLMAGNPLPAADTAWAMGEIMDGAATGAQVAGFVVALRCKGETSAEVDGFVSAMLERALPMPLAESWRSAAVDTCGTGGDRSGTVNISTMAAIIVAAAGVPVVKHGNRAATSRAGSADLLEALGIAIDLEPAGVARCVEQVGIGFCFAPRFHPALRHAAGARSELGVPTIFNVLGPLTNPARITRQAIGVPQAWLGPVLAGVLARRHASALVFRGDDGLDELTPGTRSAVWVVTDGQVSEDELNPAELGLAPATVEDLRGGDAAHNAEVARDVLAGGGTQAVRDAVALNAAAGLVAAQGTTHEPVVDQLRPALARAQEVLASGEGLDVVQRWIKASNA
ncbi:MAG TPA: anthranilate phosphoribosyltransferase [Frankiaceae bacterium]|nr:anthranilate phosphoribosyltransferase [Frankiaceae bacterium]